MFTLSLGKRQCTDNCDENHWNRENRKVEQVCRLDRERNQSYEGKRPVTSKDCHPTNPYRNTFTKCTTDRADNSRTQAQPRQPYREPIASKRCLQSPIVLNDPRNS